MRTFLVGDRPPPASEPSNEGQGRARGTSLLAALVAFAPAAFVLIGGARFGWPADGRTLGVTVFLSLAGFQVLFRKTAAQILVAALAACAACALLALPSKGEFLTDRVSGNRRARLPGGLLFMRICPNAEVFDRFGQAAEDWRVTDVWAGRLGNRLSSSPELEESLVFLRDPAFGNLVSRLPDSASKVALVRALQRDDELLLFGNLAVAAAMDTPPADATDWWKAHRELFSLALDNEAGARLVLRSDLAAFFARAPAGPREEAAQRAFWAYGATWHHGKLRLAQVKIRRQSGRK